MDGSNLKVVWFLCFATVFIGSSADYLNSTADSFNFLDAPTGTKKVDGGSFHVGDYDFIFFSEEMSWHEATKFCRDVIPGGTIAELSDRKFDKFISYLVSVHEELLQPPKRLWIGGFYEADTWKWYGSKRAIPCKAGSDAFPPWEMTRGDYTETCLAVKRSPGSCKICTVYFEPRVCEDKYGVICSRGKDLIQLDFTPETPEVEEDLGPLVSPIGEPEVHEDLGPLANPFGEPEVHEDLRPIANPLEEPVVDEDLGPLANPFGEPVVDEDPGPLANPFGEPVVDEDLGPLANPFGEPEVHEDLGPIANPFGEPVVDEDLRPIANPLGEPVVDEDLGPLANPIGKPEVDMDFDHILNIFNKPKVDENLKPLANPIGEPEVDMDFGHILNIFNKPKNG